MSEPEQILLKAASQALGQAGAELRERGWAVELEANLSDDGTYSVMLRYELPKMKTPVGLKEWINTNEVGGPLTRAGWEEIIHDANKSFGYTEPDDLWEWERGDLIREVRKLRSLVVEHHAVGVMDSTFVGDRCPVCSEFGSELADDVRAEEEDQHQSGGDDRQHDVLPGESHDEPPSRR